MKSKYRIVTDNYNGYEAQVKHWWFPFIWFQMFKCGWANSFATAEDAVSFIMKKRTKEKIGSVVRYVE